MPATKKYTNADLATPADVMDGEVPKIYPHTVDPKTGTSVYSNKLAPDDSTPPDVMDDDWQGPIQQTNTNSSANPLPVPDNASNTWMEGFKNSITSGDALNAGMQGALGFAKGAVLDLPESMYNMAKGAYHLVTNPKETISNLPSDISNAAKQMLKTTMEAGGKPEEFGRMMGQMTGQPLVTAGLAKASPTIVGGTMEGAGRFMDKYRPVSGSLPTHMIRRMARPAERMVGKGMQNVGQKIRTINNKVVSAPEGSMLEEGQTLHPDVETTYRKPVIDESVLQEGENIAPQVKPKVRLNPDGTYTDLGTGEVYDSRGKPMAESVINPNQDLQKGYTRLYRGGRLDPHPNETHLNYTADAEHAKAFSNSRKEPLHYIDIPENELGNYRNTELTHDADISRNPPSGSGYRSGPSVYSIPNELAKTSKLHEGPIKYTRSEAANYEMPISDWMKKLEQDVLNEKGQITKDSPFFKRNR